MSSQLLEWQRDTRQAQSNAKLAQAKLQRDEQLAAEGLIAQVRLQETRNQYEIAQSIAAERRQAMQLAGGVAESNQPLLALNAAVAGTVMEVLATPGQRVEMGMPVLRIARAGLLAVELQATLAQARTLRVGDSITLEGCRTPARLAAIAPSVNANNQSVVLRADFQSTEPCLRINQFVQASVKSLANTANTVNTVNTVHVPASATVQRDGKAYAFVRKPQGFAPVAVEDVRSGDAIAVQGIAALKGAWMGLGAAEASGVAGGQ
jgi:multidrug efflux pump subunit AcrA (membrane-fusion protein)